MTIGERTFIFNICVGIFNIILGLLICGFLVIGIFFVLDGFSEETRQSGFMNALLPFILIAGFFSSVAISRKCVIWVLDKFNLRDKLDPKLVSRYPKKNL